MKEINLISSQKKSLFGFYRQAKLFRTIIIIFNLALVLVMGVFLSVYFNSTKKLKANEAKIGVLKNEIGKLNKKETYLATVDNRLKKIDGILKTNISASDFLTKIKDLFVEGYSFSSLEMSSQKQAKLTGSCFDNQCLSALYLKAEEMKEKRPFSEFVFSNVSRKSNEPFELGISLKN